MGIATKLRHSLTGRIAPMVWITVCLSLFIGLTFGLSLDIVQDSVLHNTVYVGLDKNIWGWLIFGAAGGILTGMFTKKPAIISLGSVWGFMLWLYALILLGIGGHFYVMVTVGLYNTLFMGYMFLANSLGALERESLTNWHDDGTI